MTLPSGAGCLRSQPTARKMASWGPAGVLRMSALVAMSNLMAGWSLRGKKQIPWLQPAALVTDPYGHSTVEEEKCLVVTTVNVNRRCVTSPGMHFDDRELASSNSGVASSVWTIAKKALRREWRAAAALEGCRQPSPRPASAGLPATWRFASGRSRCRVPTGVPGLAEG